MSPASSLEIEEYLDAVRIALTDLPAEVGEDLLEDLPDHLGEVLAEGDGTLRERLGDPAAYADELRTAAGIDAPDPTAPTSARARLVALGHRSVESARRLDAGAGRLLGYERAVDLLHALRPGWWVLRGWIVAQLVCGPRRYGAWNGLIPHLQDSKLAGLVVTVAAVLASIWLGRRTSRFASWPRGLVIAAGVGVAVWALAVLPSALGNSISIYVSPASSDPAYYGDFSDLYVYDQNGQLVPNARLYDENGQPLQLGSGSCADGNPAPGSHPDTYNADGSQPDWTYPLCPNDPSPFRSGPGAVTASPGTSSAPTTGPALPPVSSPAPTTAGSPTATAPKPTPIATPTTTR